MKVVTWLMLRTIEPLWFPMLLLNCWNLCCMINLLLLHLRTCTNLVLKLSTVLVCVQVSWNVLSITILIAVVTYFMHLLIFRRPSIGWITGIYLTNCLMIMSHLMLLDYWHSDILIKMLLCVGTILYLNHFPYIMALDKVLHCRHIYLHDIFGIFYCVLLTPTLDVTLADARSIFWPMLTTLYCWLRHGEHFNCCLINCIVLQVTLIWSVTVAKLYVRLSTLNDVVTWLRISFLILWLIMLFSNMSTSLNT